MKTADCPPGIRRGLIALILDGGKLVKLDITCDEVDAQPDFDRKDFWGASDLPQNPALKLLYNLKLRSFVLPPTDEYLYPAVNNLKIVDLEKLSENTNALNSLLGLS